MAVLVIQEIEATEEQYRAVNAQMDTEGNPPAGLIVHTGGPIGGGRLRVVDVWESAEQFESFVAERLGPTVAQVMGEGGPQPEVTIAELWDVIRG